MFKMEEILQGLFFLFRMKNLLYYEREVHIMKTYRDEEKYNKNYRKVETEVEA